MADFFSPNLYSVPNGGSKYQLILSVNVVSQDIASNTSTVEWVWLIDKDRSYRGFYDYYATQTVVIDGSTEFSQYSQNPTDEWPGWGQHTLASGRKTITHNADGTKSISVSAEWARTASGWAPGTMTVSGSMALPTIPRATQPSVAPSPATVGSTVTISLPRASAAFTHDITWASGTLSGSIGTGIGASTTWTVPSVMGEFPGRSRAPITITAVTKSGSTVLGSKQATLMARPTPPAPSLTTPSPDSQFDIRARVVTYNTSNGEWRAGRILPTASITLVDPSSATTTCSITMSKLQAVDFADYSVVDIEVFSGTDWVYTNHRFVLSRVEGDDVDPTGTYTYSGTEFIDYELGFAYVPEDYYWDGGTNHAAPTTPGEMMRYAITQAKSRGWGPRIEIDFNGSTTSFGDPWANTAINRTISAGTPLSQILEGLVSDGYLEYRTEYRNDKAWLILLNPGTGSSYAEATSAPVVNLALAKLSRAPRRGSMEKRLTRVTVVGDSGSGESDAVKSTREQAPFDSYVFGHMEGWVSASGVSTTDAAASIGDNALRDNSSVTNERTFEYTAQDAAPQFFPYAVFVPGDWILTPGSDAPVTDRVSQVTIDKQIDGTTFTVLTGDRILSGTASLAKRQAAQTGGSIAGGNGTTPATIDSRIPSGPIISSIVSEGYWTTDGTARSEVTVSWAPVVTAINSAYISVDLYEVWWRAAVGGEWKFRGATAATTIELQDWDVLQDVELRVRARSAAGVFGEFSENQEHTTQAPAVDLDGPVIADLYTDGVGSIYIVWGGLIGVETAPLRLAYVGAEVSSNGGTTYVPMGTPIPAAGTVIVNPNAWGAFKVRLRGYDRLGNPGDASAAQDIVLTQPTTTEQIPALPTALAATAGAGWNTSGTAPIAWFDLTWTAPTLDITGSPVTITGYDVWGKRTSEANVRLLTSTETPGTRIIVNDGEEWAFQVSATSSTGGVSAQTAPTTATANATVAAAAAPSAPTLEQYAGILSIKWSGTGMQPYIKYVYATISTTAGGTYTRAGMPLIGAGEVVVPGLAPGTYYAKIVMVDERGQTSTSPAAGPITLLPITGVTVQTSSVANTGIKMTNSALTAYNASGAPTFILDATTGSVWIAPYDAVFHLGTSGKTAETATNVTGVSISSENSSFNTFVHPSGLQIRNDQTPLSWWEADASDASLVNFVSPRARVNQRLRVGDYEQLVEAKSGGATRLVFRYKGA